MKKDPLTPLAGQTHLEIEFIKSMLTENEPAETVTFSENEIAECIEIGNEKFWFSIWAKQVYPFGILNIPHIINGRHVTDQEELTKHHWDLNIKGANEGDAASMYCVACSYWWGIGVKKDYDSALYWFRKAAVKNHVASIGAIAFSYFFGQGVERDYSEAFRWYKKVAKESKAAANFIGFSYTFGLGITKNLREALKWYESGESLNNKFQLLKLLSLQGDKEMFLKLGLCYHFGKGTRGDFEKAKYWFTKAAENNCPLGMYYLGVCCLGLEYDELDYACRHYDEALSDEIKTGIEWIKKSAIKGVSEAQNILGEAYNLGVGLPADHRKAREWWEKASEQGLASAQYNLGVSYIEHQGSDLKQSLGDGIQLLIKASQQNCSKAKFKLGQLYILGNGVDPNEEHGLSLIREAADEGSSESAYYLGQLYYQGKVVEKCYMDASNWFRTAADSGHAKAQYYLGLMYENGMYLEKNLNKAKKWYQKAWFHGNLEEAKYKLNDCPFI